MDSPAADGAIYRFLTVRKMSLKAETKTNVPALFPLCLSHLFLSLPSLSQSLPNTITDKCKLRNAD